MAEQPRLEMTEENIEEEVPEATPEFDHEAHMARIQEGLQAIISSNNIQEIKQIAQSLLVEEQAEESAEGEGDFNFREQALAAMQGGADEA